MYSIRKYCLRAPNKKSSRNNKYGLPLKSKYSNYSIF